MVNLEKVTHSFITDQSQVRHAEETDPLGNNDIMSDAPGQHNGTDGFSTQ